VVAYKLLLCIVELVHLQLVVEVPNLVQSVLHDSKHAAGAGIKSARLRAAAELACSSASCLDAHETTVTSGRKQAQVAEHTQLVLRDAQLPPHSVDGPASWP
jgi:hypothetical protein